MALKILALEPYLGGSHAAFLDGLRAHSRHSWTVRGLPARKWKWRMRQAPVAFAQAAEDDCVRHDVVLASDYLDIAAWRGLAPRREASLPVVAYFHENQLTYPVRSESERDYHFGWTNFASCLAADEVWFNSDFHRRTFFEALPRFLRRMPDGDPAALVETARERSRVVFPGIDPPLAEPVAGAVVPPARDLRILWNHRWEFDKAPERFFAALDAVAARDCPFELVVLGQRFRDCPPVFGEARERYRDRIAHWGYVPDRAAYLAWVASCDVVVSTAIHEFFGLSVLEAIARGCFPLLPDRLAYPELIPEVCVQRHIYASDADLVDRLEAHCRMPWSLRDTPPLPWVQPFFWPQRAAEFDRLLALRAGGVMS